ncbi:helix-turn-helix domain-containing protein [Bradyrhizobium zhanjiangense]|uniref:Insertion element IS150 protein InsJ-like helix-turn-helix domain-containing protein n=1 Tax=Bradyrhizobium zhanjiangense TaxID=1325107 RepID=A0A4Q0Q8C1_9BRAD|nr:hypothetical protein EAS61_35595 [Bradyrhizobium zhanjiangense]
MPWKSNTLLEARSEFVQLALAPNANIQSLCRSFNISRQTGYRTLEGYRIAGARGLESQSRRPHHTPHRCPDPTESAVLSTDTFANAMLTSRAIHGARAASSGARNGSQPSSHLQTTSKTLGLDKRWRCSLGQGATAIYESSTSVKRRQSQYRRHDRDWTLA